MEIASTSTEPLANDERYFFFPFFLHRLREREVDGDFFSKALLVHCAEEEDESLKSWKTSFSQCTVKLLVVPYNAWLVACVSSCAQVVWAEAYAGSCEEEVRWRRSTVLELLEEKSMVGEKFPRQLHFAGNPLRRGTKRRKVKQ
ncbi:unnamed protein product [Linum trigynum]|uniref:Uncharacterized protein n=1 Tax=Linum trigynum TaxID=586398 RepID=A0AAV2CEF4_9ROSI